MQINLVGLILVSGNIQWLKTFKILLTNYISSYPGFLDLFALGPRF